MMLIHLSNVFLDRIFPSLTNPFLGTHRRERLKKILEEIVEAGIRRKAKGLLIAGNLLSDKWITDDTVKWLVDLFESIRPIRVFISPGEADCICEDSVYLYQRFPENVFVFTKPEWEVFVDKESSLCVVGYGKWGDGNYIGKPPEMFLSREMNNVCLAYDLEFDVGEVFSVSDVPFSYVALGNGLSEEKKVLSNDVVICNSGAVEQFGFFQKGMPGFYCIHFAFNEGGWKVSDIERVSIKDSTTYRELIIDCSSYVDAENLLHELVLMIKDIPSPRIVRVRLVGSISLSVFDEVMSNLGRWVKNVMS